MRATLKKMKKKMKKKKIKNIEGKGRNTRRPAKQSWVQPLTPYKKDVFVCTGFSEKEIQRAIKKIGAKKWWLDFVDRSQGTWKELIEKGCAFVAQEERHGAFLLRLRPFEDTWDYWEVLIHELHHLVHGLAEHLAMEKETEAQAYLQEHLFNKIRRKLLGNEPYDTA